LVGPPGLRHSPLVQAAGEVQEPQLAVRARPQLSVPESGSHSFDCRAQKAASVSWAQATQCLVVAEQA